MKKFEYTPPEQPRELILKLGQKITDRIGHTVTAEDPEYYGLEALVTDEMAEVALKMKVRKPMTLAQAVKATGKEEKERRLLHCRHHQERQAAHDRAAPALL